MAVHHLNLAHGLALGAVRDELGEDARTSVTLNLSVNVAESDSAEDQAAKHRADLLANEVFLGPMLEGRYDPEIFEVTREVTDWAFAKDGDADIIKQPLSVLGLNYYSTNHVRHATGTPKPAQHGNGQPVRHPEMPAQEQVRGSATHWSAHRHGLEPGACRADGDSAGTEPTVP
ncbi:family 1 glycosylhydrolase [Bifidobacterium aemilianum]|uniref:family 1 glycosylhydrolase n=1 Tax=Bifidobacterium aemilianum TaxID=2493120 RepID=UPI001EEF2B75|nr:family 1 glycosylhydrolase [Bifidobacterium aemilianum]